MRNSYLKTIILFVIMGAIAQGNYGPGEWAQSENWEPSGPIWEPLPATYDDVWVITPPQAPGPVLIPGIQYLRESKDTINWCLADIKAKGLIAFYYAIVDNVGNDVCYLVQSLFNSCLGDLNIRTCTIFTLENGGSLCNVYNSTGVDLTSQIINIHYGIANTSTILPFINTSAVRDLIIATNHWCPE